MSYTHRHTLTITTDGSGDATSYTEVVSGRISSIRYIKTDYTDGVDVTVTGETTGTAIWTGTNVNASATVAPRQATHDTVGAASLYAAGGEPVESSITIANERIKFVVASGGATKVGAFHVTLD